MVTAATSNKISQIVHGKDYHKNLLKIFKHLQRSLDWSFGNSLQKYHLEEMLKYNCKKYYSACVWL